MRTIALLTICLAVLAVTGCMTRTTPLPVSLRVPADMSVEDVRSAILSALRGSYTHLSTAPPGSQWYPAGEKSGVIYATYESKGQHVLNASIQYEQERVTVAISGSEGLRQSELKIHKVARLWFRTLVNQLKVELGRAAVVSMQGPEPSDSTTGLGKEPLVRRCRELSGPIDCSFSHIKNSDKTESLMLYITASKQEELGLRTEAITAAKSAFCTFTGTLDVPLEHAYIVTTALSSKAMHTQSCAELLRAKN